MSGRPFLYLSLPGVAFIIGMYWYHRRNKRIRCESGGNNKAKTIDQQKNNTNNTQNGALTNGNIQNKASRSMSINNGSIGHHKHGQPDIEDDISASMKQFGKSAPINIIPNGGSRISPVLLLQQQNQVDSEVLKSKIQDAEHKILRSIDEDFENLSSPVDLPDSIHNKRLSFYARHANIKRDEPVVIKATTTPKISPENSFLESKYVKSSDINNFDDLPCASNIISATTRALSQSPPSTNNNNINNSNIKLTDATELSAIEENKNEAQSQKQENQLELKPKTKILDDEEQKPIELQTNLTELEKSTETTTSTTSAETAITTIVNDDERKVDVASPSLSLCSEQSGDSGKGSSLPRSEAARAKTKYEFLFPTALIGHLYGRNRSFITQIIAESGANVVLLPETTNEPMHKRSVRICVVEGTESEINAALSMIRQRLPFKRYPNLTMQRIHYAQPQTVVPLSAESLLSLQVNIY